LGKWGPGLGEAELKEAGSGVHRDRPGGVTAVLVGGVEFLQYVGTAARAGRDDVVDGASDLGLPLRRHRRGENIDEEAIGKVRPRGLGADPQRIEQAAIGAVGAQLDRLDVLV